MLSSNKEYPAIVKDFIASMPDQPLMFTTPSLDFAMSSRTIQKMINQVYCLQKEIFKNEISVEALIILVHRALLYFNLLTRPPSKKKTYPVVESAEKITEQDLDLISTHDFDPTLTNTQKAYYFYQRGRLLNIFDHHHLASQQNLEKSVKLNPKCLDAWKCLGECYWKNGNLKAAESAFRWALGVENCKSTMLLLAMVIRRKAITKVELEESIKLCKDSLKLQLEESRKDGFKTYSTVDEGWGRVLLNTVGLGSSYMALYFKCTLNMDDLKRALSAYNQAVPKTNKGESQNPDLYYSRALIQQYLENCNESIKDFQIASKLDPRMAPRSLKSILMIKKYQKGVLKQLNQKLNLTQPEIESFLRKLEDIGQCMTNLKEGKNKGLINLLILGSVNRYHDNIGRSFICIDRNSNWCVASFFHLKPKVINVGDVVTLKDPTKIKFEFDSEKETADFIRVDCPFFVLVNGNRVADDQLEHIQMKVDSCFE